MKDLEWFYEGQPVDELPENTHGFIYRLTLVGNKFYIGKKNCLKKLTLPALKSGEIRPGAERILKRKPMTLDELGERSVRQMRDRVMSKLVPFDVLYKTSGWKAYTSSSDDINPSQIIYKEILEFAPTKRSLTYLEEKHQFLNNVLEDDTYLNQNIGGRYFRGKLL